MPAPDESAVHANAYAIAYRLLGDRPAAQAAVGIAVERVRAAGALERPDWLAHVAAATVSQAVGVASVATTPSADPAHDGLRAAMRRRLASASDDERVAASLHHLAGYPVDQVAALMGRPVDEVARLTRALAPPPGVSNRDLGDPELVGASTSAASQRRRTVSISTVVTALVVLALVFGVSRCVGPRPTLGPEPERVPVQVGPDVPSRPTDGCSSPPATPGTFAATAGSADGDVPFRLAVPVPAAPLPTPAPPSSTTPGGTANPPRPLVLAVTDTGQPVDAFAATTGLERDALEAGYLVATISPGEPGTTDAVDQASAVLRAILRDRCVDAARVSVAGLGSGGQTATALACAAAEVVTVAAPVGGATLPADCDLAPAVSLQVLWSADDQVLPPAGGYGPQAVPPSQAAPPLPPTPAGEITATWARLVGAGQPARSTSPDGTAIEDATSPDGVGVRSVITPTGGHSWTPGTTDAVLAFAQSHARSS